MDDNILKNFCEDMIALDILTDLYTKLAGISHGFVEAYINHDHLSRKEAEDRIMKIDEMARKRVNKAYKHMLKEEERQGETE